MLCRLHHTYADKAISSTYGAGVVRKGAGRENVHPDASFKEGAVMPKYAGVIKIVTPAL